MSAFFSSNQTYADDSSMEVECYFDTFFVFRRFNGLKCISYQLPKKMAYVDGREPLIIMYCLHWTNQDINLYNAE